MPIILDGTGTISGVSSTGLSSAQNVPYANLPTGSVLQVVNAITTSTVTVTSTSYSDTNLTATITPKFATSKILILISQRIYKNQACSNGANILLIRNGSTTLLTDSRVGLNDTSTVGSDQRWNVCYLDSPATTSATTYKTQIANSSGNGTVYANLDSNQAQITLMEIAG